MRIGMVVESTGLGVRPALAAAARMGAAGVQVDATGDLAPQTLGATGRREFRNLLRSYNQELAALHVPLRRGLDATEQQQPRLEKIQHAMQLAYDLGAGRVVVPCPKLPDDAATPRARTLREALAALGRHGDRIGAVLALEIGFEPAAKVKEYLGSFETGSLKVTFDPVNFLLHGHDPLANLSPLKELLAHVHARDARSASLSRGLQEVPVGAGNVDWMALMATLQVMEYDGFAVVERDQGQNKLQDVIDGVKFLKRFAMG